MTNREPSRDVSGADGLALHDSLERLEHAVETPVISGELDEWLSTVGDALADVAVIYGERIDSVHAPQFEEIGSEDSGLLSHVEDMRAADAGLLDDLKKARATLDEMSRRMQQIPNGETDAEMEMPQFVRETISLVVRMRTVETQLETWLNEALLRDRGVVD